MSPYLFATALLLAVPAYSASNKLSRERLLPAGDYLPFLAAREKSDLSSKTEAPRKRAKVASFWLDVRPVTQSEFLEFVKKNPEWRRSRIARVFADESYLKYWRADLKLRAPSDSNRPVIQVSWFAANAYCQAQGRDLPTTDEWEYAADDFGRDSDQVRRQILAWYSVPNTAAIGQVRKQPPNGYGIHDLHGLIWEWTQDFGSAMSGSESRSDGTTDTSLFCGSGSLNAVDPSDYAKFMRYSLRSSLKADYTTANLGFRCARKAVILRESK